MPQETCRIHDVRKCGRLPPNKGWNVNEEGKDETCIFCLFLSLKINEKWCKVTRQLSKKRFSRSFWVEEGMHEAPKSAKNSQNSKGLQIKMERD